METATIEHDDGTSEQVEIPEVDPDTGQSYAGLGRERPTADDFTSDWYGRVPGTSVFRLSGTGGRAVAPFTSWYPLAPRP